MYLYSRQDITSSLHHLFASQYTMILVNYSITLSLHLHVTSSLHHLFTSSLHHPLTEKVLRSSSQELVEDVVAPLSVLLMDHSRLLQQVYTERDRHSHPPSLTVWFKIFLSPILFYPLFSHPFFPSPLPPPPPPSPSSLFTE